MSQKRLKKAQNRNCGPTVFCPIRWPLHPSMASVWRHKMHRPSFWKHKGPGGMWPHSCDARRPLNFPKKKKNSLPKTPPQTHAVPRGLLLGRAPKTHEIYSRQVNAHKRLQSWVHHLLLCVGVRCAEMNACIQGRTNRKVNGDHGNWPKSLGG